MSRAMRINRSLSHVAVFCAQCEYRGKPQEGDTGADLAGLEMIAHVIRQPGCSGRVYLVGAKPGG